MCVVLSGVYVCGVEWCMCVVYMFECGGVCV